MGQIFLKSKICPSNRSRKKILLIFKSISNQAFQPKNKTFRWSFFTSHT